MLADDTNVYRKGGEQLMTKHKKSLFVICDSCKGKHLRSMTVEKKIFSTNAIDTYFIGLSCLTMIEKKMLDTNYQVGNMKIVKS